MKFKNNFRCIKNLIFIGVIFYLSMFSIQCGYSTKSALPGNIKTIHVEPFKNSIDFTAESERNIYFPMLEVDVRNAVINRFLFDGNLRIAEPEAADMVMKGDLVGYNRQPLRYTDGDDVEEYRVQIIVNLTLYDKNGEPIWIENGFAGEATYFVSGPRTGSESTAVNEATTDFARRAVERTIENW